MSKKPSLSTAQGAVSVVRRGRYSNEFKQDAVRLVAEEQYSFTAAAAAVNVCEKSLRDWHAKFAPKPAPCGDGVQENASPPVSYVMNDACRAVQFVRLNAAKWNLDARRIAVGGGSQGTLSALYVGCAGERADPNSKDTVERISTKVACVGAYRSPPSIDPLRMQVWVPGVKWGAPALGYGFEESLRRRNELLPVIEKWSPEALLHKGAAPIYFENNWGLTQPENIGEMDYKVHSPA